jgi:nucleotide-binding universal stress UspA family protein
MSIDTIVVPVDFSEKAKKGVDYALLLAKKLNAHLIFLHTYALGPPPRTGMTMSAMTHPADLDMASLEKLNRLKLRDYLDQFPDLSNVNHKLITGLGTPAEVICQVAEDEKADFILMGTGGASKIEGFFIGTVSEKVSRKAPCSVMVVPRETSHLRIDSVGLALDTNHLDNKSG